MWRKNVNRERARWMVISGMGMGTTLAMHMWL